MEKWPLGVFASIDAGLGVKLEVAHELYSLADAVIALTTNIAAREGKRIDFMPEWFDMNRTHCPENPRNDPAKKPDVKRYDAPPPT